VSRPVADTPGDRRPPPDGGTWVILRATHSCDETRKKCATGHDEHVPESSIKILGHSVGGLTSRHDAHRVPLAFNAIMTVPQPTAFSALIKGYDGECPCCRRRFADAG
jgi:hypothetical protein